jgi:SAM-dependent methyltransferase
MSASAIAVSPIDSLRVDWLEVERCPVCDFAPARRDPILDCGYVFGEERIEFPAGGIAVAWCDNCGLRYKTRVPDPASLSKVMERQAGRKWMEPYDFQEEVEQLKEVVGDPRTDLLDVGCGSGRLLEAWSHYGRGRRSALDVVQHPGCAKHVDGEFIHGLLDGTRLRWSGTPYHVVTLFDVLEHLYSPRAAFAHLRELVRDNGIVIIETGNVDSTWPIRHGAHHWWYVRLFEHHVFWSRRSLEYIADQFDFRLLVWRDVRHKGRASVPLKSKLNDAAQVGLYRLAPRLYPNIAPLFGKYWTQPWSPFTHDHFRVVLRKT